jgi:hypothetical protein
MNYPDFWVITRRNVVSNQRFEITKSLVQENDRKFKNVLHNNKLKLRL